MPKIRESFPIKNKLESDNVKKCDSDPLKIRKYNAENFGHNEQKNNIKIETKNANNCDPDSFKNEKELANNSDDKINSHYVARFSFKNRTNLKKFKSSNKKFNPAFTPHFFSKHAFFSQGSFYFKNVRFDKNMSRTPKILSSNLGGKRFRFNMTSESRIS